MNTAASFGHAVVWPPFPSPPCSGTVLAGKGALRRIVSNPERFSSARAQIAPPLPAAGRSEDFLMRRERGKCKGQKDLQVLIENIRGNTANH